MKVVLFHQNHKTVNKSLSERNLWNPIFVKSIFPLSKIKILSVDCFRRLEEMNTKNLFKKILSNIDWIATSSTSLQRKTQMPVLKTSEPIKVRVPFYTIIWLEKKNVIRYFANFMFWLLYKIMYILTNLKLKFEKSIF